MNRRTATAGFSLLEVLIALALSLLLVTAVYAAIDLYFQYSLAGRAEIAGQQLMRGLLHRLDSDLSSLSFALPASEPAAESSGQAAADSSQGSASSTGAGSSASSGAASSSFGSGQSSGISSSGSAADAFQSRDDQDAAAGVNFLGLSDAGLPENFGLIGTADLLHLSVSQPLRELAYAEVHENVQPGSRFGDRVIVTYGLAPISPDVLAALRQNPNVQRPDQGLGRRVRDVLAPEAVDATLTSEDLLAWEVCELTFRYFDGTEWLESWDSPSLGALPRAIEVTYGIWNPPVANLRGPQRQEAGTVTEYVHVFHVPLSEPAVTETAP
jgi:prepilin-type N-terminal cleavage/methylation domain-containing protein